MLAPRLKPPPSPGPARRRGSRGRQTFVGRPRQILRAPTRWESRRTLYFSSSREDARLSPCFSPARSPRAAAGKLRQRVHPNQFSQDESTPFSRDHRVPRGRDRDRPIHRQEPPIGLDMVPYPGGPLCHGTPTTAPSTSNWPIPSAWTAFSWTGSSLVTQEIYEKLTGRNPSRQKNPKNPVEQVNWGNAVKFCKNARLGRRGVDALLQSADLGMRLRGERLPPAQPKPSGSMFLAGPALTTSASLLFRRPPRGA